MNDQTQQIDLTKIHPSPFQHRKKFELLEELAKSITDHGVLEPILLRPHPKKKGEFELVFGERRVRASKLAKVKGIEAKVRDLSDEEVVKLQIIENVQRQDVHPLEEADGYGYLQKKGHDIPAIAAMVGKSTAYIYGRLRLGALGPEGRTALLETEGFTTSIALIVAQIVDPKSQKQAVDDLVGQMKHRAISTADARQTLHGRFLLRLKTAPFKRDDASLVSAAGPCTTCPKRSGVQPDLFGEGEGRDDLCLDRSCFDEKRDAGWKKQKAEAQAAGQKVIPDAEVKTLFPYGHGSLTHGTKFVDLDATSFVGGKEKKRFGLLNPPKEAIVLVRDPDGTVHRLIEKTVGKELLAKAPAEVKSALSYDFGVRESSSGTNGSGAGERSKFELKRKIDLEANRRIVQAIIEKVEAKKGFDDQFIRLLVEAMARAVWADAANAVAKRRELPLGKAVSRGDDWIQPGVKAILDEAEKASGPKLVGLLVEPMLHQGDAVRKQAAELLGVDAKTIREVVAGEFRAKQKAKTIKKPAKKEKARAPA